VTFAKIVWQDNINEQHDNNQQVGVASWILSVDGTHCRIKEPRAVPDKHWYSHKFHKPGVAYELGVNLFENKLVWMSGPYKAGDTDIVIFRKPDGLKSKLDSVNQMAIGDKGYAGDLAVSTPSAFDCDDVNIFKRRARARHEDFNRQIKNFAVLSERFRHSVDKHKTVLLTQYSLENGQPLYDI
jgi:DDE superfamily endonuclease